MLEPRETPAQEVALRQQILGLQEDVQRRIAEVSRLRLSGSDQRTLEDARTFLDQSIKALGTSDLHRALNLVRKASLLVAALEHQS